jgi:phage tail sheath protein FI
VAVLHLPAHHGERAARGYRGRLLAAAERDAAGTPLDDRTLSFGMLAHPWPVTRPTGDAAPGAEPPDGVLCGLLAARALGRGAWTSAANLPAGDVLALAPPIRDPAPDPYVNWLRETPRGFVTLGDDTPSDDSELRELHVRRLLALLRRLAAREGAVYAFQPHDESLRRLVRRTFERVLGELFARGAFAGRTHDEAYRVVADDTVNTAQSVDLGRLVVELRVAPARALAFLTVRLVETGGALRVEGA